MAKIIGLMITIVGLPLGIMAGVVVLSGCSKTQNRATVDPALPVYIHGQTDSTHAGYRHSSVASKDAVFVNDYEEASLQLINSDPTNVVGRAPFGGGKICTISGQPPTDYLAVDVGSAMPAYVVYRNQKLPPFNWRRATFQKLEIALPAGAGGHKSTTDPGVIDDVLRSMKAGTPISGFSVVATNLATIHLFSDQLPGLVFSPTAYLDEDGTVYLSESIYTETSKSAVKIFGHWIPAGQRFAKWAQK